ncbi:hypothetical protein MFIFM68171_04878 [Madurella fahalii]|uniref:Uncharacterized protein n=1 Tax=Madurella fahalii TaxID=1157608 RepID=A0ABQ0GA72_9PEZI
MATQHLICISWKGKWVIAQYGQWDGYPESQGVKLCKFLAWDKSRRELDYFGFGWERKPMDGLNQLYPSLSNNTSSRILGIIARAAITEPEDVAERDTGQKSKRIPVSLDLEFANDDVLCEWAYVIDLDKEVLEVYGGAENKHPGHRFVNVGDGEDCVPCFIGSFDF